VILSGEVPQLAGIEKDPAWLKLGVHELFIYTFDSSQALQVKLAQSNAAVDTFSKQLAKVASLGITESSFAENIIEDIRLHL
jgi:hypothetical protein